MYPNNFLVKLDTKLRYLHNIVLICNRRETNIVLEYKAACSLTLQVKKTALKICYVTEKPLFTLRWQTFLPMKWRLSTIERESRDLRRRKRGSSSWSKERGRIDRRCWDRYHAKSTTTASLPWCRTADPEERPRAPLKNHNKKYILCDVWTYGIS